LGADGVPDVEVVRAAALFCARARDDWAGGLTVLTALANLLPALQDDERYLALYQGLRWIAADCAGVPARRARQPLPADSTRDLATLARWLREWTRVRHRDGVERTLLTAISAGTAPGQVARLLLEAVSDRYFADGGHALDFINKGFELLDHIGWEHASAVLPTLVGPLAEARGAEEKRLVASSGRSDSALRSGVRRVAGVARGWCAKGRGSGTSTPRLPMRCSATSPAAIIEALKNALRDGARGVDLGRSLACAAALRVARFGTSNEHSDWDTAHHAFTYCNALHQLLKRIGTDTPAALRGVFHGAMRLWLIRFLNVPPARLPEDEALDDLPRDADGIREAFLLALDRQGSVREGGAARRPRACARGIRPRR
jgi:hypothetical protein